jgi:hypothetical protein
MLTIQGKEVFAGMSRKSIDDREGHNLLLVANETLQPQTHKKAFGFSIQDRALLKDKK